MNWHNVFDPALIAIDGAVGALAVLLAYLATIKMQGEKKRKIFVIAIVVAWGVLNVLAGVLVKPQARRANVSSELKKLATYEALEKYEPEMFRQIVDKVIEIQNQGKNRQEAVATVRPLIQDAIRRNSARASDEVVLKLADFSVRQIEELEKDGSDRCFRLLYPRQGEPRLLAKDFPEQMVAEEAAVQVLVIRSGSMNEGLAMPAEQAEGLLGEVVAALASEHGEGVGVLARVSEPDVDRRLACRLTAAMFSKIIALPPDKGPALLRYVYSSP